MSLCPWSLAGLVSLLCNLATAAPSLSLGARDLGGFITSERAIALQGALNNIGPNGSVVPGAGAGYVVASPSKENPDCKFACVVNGKFTQAIGLPWVDPHSSKDITLIVPRFLYLDSRFGFDSEDDHRRIYLWQHGSSAIYQ